MSIYMTGDQHYFHEKVIYYEDRPFKNTKQMENELLKNHNAIVTENDICYHLGDFAFLSSSQVNKLERIIAKMNGRNVLILGNHDEGRPGQYLKMGFESVHTSLVLPEDNRFILSHDPASSIAAKDCIWIVAHIHSLFRIQKNCINVGVDVNDYKPISFESIKKEMLNE